jgi:hypothetical protein
LAERYAERPEDPGERTDDHAALSEQPKAAANEDEPARKCLPKRTQESTLKIPDGNVATVDRHRSRLTTKK